MRRRRSKHARQRVWLLLALLVALGGYFAYERFAVLLRAPAPPPEPAGALIAHWDFDDPKALDIWEKKVFKPGTVFRVIPEEGGFVRSESRNACTGLFVRIETAEMSGLHLSWRWRAVEFPKKRKNVLSFRPEDDFAARVYVIFEAKNLFRSDVIEYVWDASLPPGTAAQSPFSDRIQLMVLQSGPAGTGERGWRSEKRDIYADYRKLFGREPKNAVGLIALMSDSDSTGTSAAADFGPLTLTKEG